ncbi:carbohydrate porin [Scleromatobacter humisilvae]|uniref:Carbohydrate porin n=1 Tax=Scleromatobacter humisilvae TaxID=2897159 RepID=A0A9X1YNM2_9BURK|nr:carbohydrate porin [Scleromatobacter humisilvae]MCK9689351.1 carbohydrate porin [Scleromatobacter humisilvae]
MQFFYTLLLAALLLPAPALAQDQESWNAHFQSTYIRQVQPAFHSPYEGPHSLRGERGASYSLTATASLGARLGNDTEVYVDPEAVQGVPLSGLGGLAAFPNGELAKTSGANLKLYRARLFVRHTFELGGDDVAVDSDANQLKSTYQSRRLVVTAGNVSVLDLFDASSHAHDPRTQFMNWALMTYGAYDYPADARGYTNGLALDYDDGPWTLRAGRFAEPKLPNGLPLDNDLLRHYGDQIELVHTHALGAYAGAVRVLAFRSRARMSTYEDALAAAPIGEAPSLNAVRAGDHVKTGIGIDAEQQVASDLVLFVRAMKADGKTETYAFTESDASVTAGLSLKGARWSRDKDVVGLAVGEDAISTVHRVYLERGGLTSFLGDGTLRYGHERMAEAYYSAELGAGFTLTADVQRVANPGYNKDRGPASFYALRLHWEV